MSERVVRNRIEESPAATRDADQFKPLCTVVIATHDRPGLLDRCLAALAQLDYARFDVIVVDNAPTDTRTHEVALRHGVRYCIEPVLGVNRARNRGARSTEADIIAYVDDDAVPERGWLSALIEEFKDPFVMAAAGKNLPLNTEAETEKSLGLRRGFNLGQERRKVDRQTPFWFEIANFGGIGIEMNMAFRRSAFEVWPGFDERIGYGTAIAGCTGHSAFFSLIKKDYRVAYTPHAVVHHAYPQTLKDLRTRHLKSLRASAGYLTLLFVEQRHYRAAVLRYVIGYIRGMKRVWRPEVTIPMRIAPRWRELLACLPGPFLYMQVLLKQKLTGGSS